MNYSFNHNDTTSKEYVELQQKLIDLNARVVLCTISPQNVKQRLIHRATYTNEIVTQAEIARYIENQQRFVDIANKSIIPTMIINTDNLNWEGYAKMLLEEPV